MGGEWGGGGVSELRVGGHGWWCRGKGKRSYLHTTSARQAADGGLGNALDVVAKDLAVALSAALAKALASFSSSGHD